MKYEISKFSDYKKKPNIDIGNMLCSVANKSMTRLMSLSLPIQQDSHLPRVGMHPQLSVQLSTPEAQLQTSKHQISLSVCHLKHIQGPHI